ERSREPNTSVRPTMAPTKSTIPMAGIIGRPYLSFPPGTVDEILMNHLPAEKAATAEERGLDPNLTPHDLRDTAATVAFANGATVKEVQRMLGHAKASVTLDQYTGVLDSMTARTDERFDAAFRSLTPGAAIDAKVAALRG